MDQERNREEIQIEDSDPRTGPTRQPASESTEQNSDLDKRRNSLRGRPKTRRNPT